MLALFVSKFEFCMFDIPDLTKDLDQLVRRRLLKRKYIDSSNDPNEILYDKSVPYSGTYLMGVLRRTLMSKRR